MRIWVVLLFQQLMLFIPSLHNSHDEGEVLTRVFSHQLENIDNEFENLKQWMSQ